MIASQIMHSKFLSGLRTAALAVTASWTISAYSQVNVTTYHNDNLRTGLNPNESTLNPSNVNPANFGLLFSLPVDGQVYAQPLYLSNLTIPGKGVHNVVFVATQHDSVYAFDANTNNGAELQPLWHVNFGPSLPYTDVYAPGGGDINPEIGITATPVIGTSGFSTPVLYVVSKTKLTGTGGVAYVQQLHALNAATGAEMFGGPIDVNGLAIGTGDASFLGYVQFNPLIQQERAALLLLPPTVQAEVLRHDIIVRNPPPQSPASDGTLYLTYASHGDNGPYHGWVFGYDPKDLAQVSSFNTTPNALTDPSGYPIAAGGIWQGGGGPASDGTSIYYATGNGTFNTSNGSYGDSVVRMLNRAFSVADFFSPADQFSLDDNDTDEGSGGVMLIPPSLSGTNNKSLVIQTGKEGSVYLLDTTNLGGNGQTNNVWQELPYTIGGIWGAPAYFNNTIYYGPVGSPIVSIPISGGFLSNAPTNFTPTYYGYPGPTPSISSLGTTNGIVWAIDATNGYTTPAVLHAYQASNISNEIYNSAMNAGRDAPGGGIKFSTPTIANGKVYVGTANSVAVYGLGTWAQTPSISPPGGAYTGSIQVSITDPTEGATIRYTLDGSTPTPSSPAYTKPITVNSSTTVSAKAFNGNQGGSPTAQNGYVFNAVIGTGTGLFGAYFNAEQMYPTGYPTATEIDPTINFNWNGNSPIAGVGGTNWAGEWFGYIQPETSGTYTFTTNSDDGVQVYINGQAIINDYNVHAATLDTGTYSFTVGKLYTIQILYFQNLGGSLLQMSWSAAGIPQQIVPSTQLYPVPIK